MVGIDGTCAVFAVAGSAFDWDALTDSTLALDMDDGDALRLRGTEGGERGTAISVWGAILIVLVAGLSLIPPSLGLIF